MTNSKILIGRRMSSSNGLAKGHLKEIEYWIGPVSKNLGSRLGKNQLK